MVLCAFRCHKTVWMFVTKNVAYDSMLHTLSPTPVLFTDSFRNRQKLLSLFLFLPFPHRLFPATKFSLLRPNVYDVPGTGLSFLCMCVCVCGTRAFKKTLAFRDGKPKNLHINEMYKHRLFEKWLCEHFAQTPNATRELIMCVCVCVYERYVLCHNLKRNGQFGKTGNNNIQIIKDKMGRARIATVSWKEMFKNWRSKIRELRENEILTIKW